MVNVLLEIVGFGCVVGFAYFVWPPLVLLVVGAAFIAAAQVDRGRDAGAS